MDGASLWAGTPSVWGVVDPTTEIDPLGLAPCDPLPRPEVDDPKLKNTIDELYKGVDNPERVGNGTTMDAIRHEVETGERVHGCGHLSKGYERRKTLVKWIRSHPRAMARDLLVARRPVMELIEVLPGAAVRIP